MSDEFFDLRATHNSHRWFLPVIPNICVGPRDKLFLFGGVGLAAALAAAERTTKRPTIWATSQYLSYARPGAIVDFDVREVTVGNAISQVRVSAHIGDKEILSVNAALGEREGLSDQWLAMPDVPAPEACEPVKHWRGIDESVNARIEMRVAHGRYPTRDFVGGRGEDGRLMLWMRPLQGHAITRELLAVMADFVSSANTSAIGKRAGGNSLDNTIRFGKLAPTEWVLCDIRVEAIVSGITHGVMHLFNQRGELLASASQSLILRIHE
jgi:acyl-CoA thioesterase